VAEPIAAGPEIETEFKVVRPAAHVPEGWTANPADPSLPPLNPAHMGGAGPMASVSNDDF
jgi:hypothetical protein